jgi:hypothetical protein
MRVSCVEGLFDPFLLPFVVGYGGPSYHDVNAHF